ncbi:hypothetical protein ACJ73_00542 [Blastomyces percursus]|uniref:Uncharacterized protein n=1 Tax=Blastomyces percursus TaxID=1658174 RepID=A0A1J9R6Q7_9EURO|nr:hypothetical protein ACJ73_00542 [Blastomyces percursus]
MAFTFVDFKLGEKAIELSLVACGQEPDSWELQFCLARAYGQIGEHRKALEVLATVIEAFREDEKLLEERRHFFCREHLRKYTTTNLTTLKEISAFGRDCQRCSELRTLLFIRRWYALYKFPESGNDLKEALTIWEENVGLTATSKGTFIDTVDGASADYLASVYLGKAKQEGFDGPLAERYLTQLQHICELWPEQSHLNFGRLILGRFYSPNGKASGSAGGYKMVEEVEDQAQEETVGGQEGEGHMLEQGATVGARPHPDIEEKAASDGQPNGVAANTTSDRDKGGCKESDTTEPQCSGDASDALADDENDTKLSTPDKEARSRSPSPAPSRTSRVGTLDIRCGGDRHCDRI